VRVFGRYLLFQAPGWIIAAILLVAVGEFVVLPSWLPYGLVGALILKDLLLFPLVRTAYQSNPSSPVGPSRLVGARGIATERLDPSGYVRLGGELWRAEGTVGALPIPKDGAVRVCEVRGLTLIVEPDESG
jgi:membrane protein implicated in regulation of membrane protease activity